MTTEAQKYSATLARGEVYYLRDVRFDRGVAICIDDAMKEHLEEHAVDEITTTDTVQDEEGDAVVEIIFKHKFEYVEYEGPAEVGQPIEQVTKRERKIEPASTPAPRNRVRSR